MFYEEMRRPQSAAVSSETVYAEERLASMRRFRRLRLAGCTPRPLSVAFSGGGVRAAAFQCGVIWRLAAEGRLKDVEHMSLVSGGSYVGTALVTFLLAGIRADADGGQGGQVAQDDVDTWYLRVVWRLIERMQSNAGFLIRFSRRPFTRKGSRPPVHGIVLFLAVLLFAFAILPVINFVYVTIPIALLVDVNVGAAMRLAWCSSVRPLLEWTLRWGVGVLGLLVSAAVLQMAMLSLKQRVRSPSKGQARLLMAMLGTQSVALRAGVFMAILVVLVWGTVGLQWVDHQGEIKCGRVNHLASDPRRCVDMLDSERWYHDLDNATRDATPEASPRGPPTSFWLLSTWPLWLGFNALVAALGVLGSCLKWRLLFIRGNHVAALLSPMWAGFAGMLVLRWRIFGPLEQEQFRDHWHSTMTLVLCLAVLLLPFYGKLRRLVHVFYRRSLRRAFYHDGKDVALSESEGVTLCPNVIVAATVVDYCRPFEQDDAPHFSEFFFTPRWMGGERTGFIDVPRQMSLCRVMAISGAATDAFLLTKMNALWVRVTLLALFNLFMGDYIEFKSNSRQAKWWGRCQTFCVNIIFVLFFAMMYVSDDFAFAEDGHSCKSFYFIVWSAWGLLGTLLIASFFAGFRGLSWLLSSTTIRHLHMAMMHYHISDEPPLRLFLNDGGLVECLGLISLLRRRCEFMLVTDATADFRMELVCLRQTMKLAEGEKICTFFDPSDPRRGVEPLLRDFAKSKDTFLRMGVLYDSWEAASGCAPEERRTGEIYFIRMRLLDCGRCVQHSRITEEEVVALADRSVRSSSAAHQLLREDVGGCCCDCCHTRCNCGLVGRFPDISSGNQFLTPTQFALLCRLGYEISAGAVEALTDSQGRATAAPPPPQSPPQPPPRRPPPQKGRPADGAIAGGLEKGLQELAV